MMAITVRFRNSPLMPNAFRALRAAAISIALAVPVMLASSAVTRADSQAQNAYDACVDTYNSTFRSLKGYKAIVAGVTGSVYQCFWIGGQKTLSDAINKATKSCEAKQASCFLYADSNGHSSWSKRIALLGGNDGTKGGGGGNGGGGNDAAAAAALVEGLLSGAAILNSRPAQTYRAPPPPPPSQGGGPPTNCASGAFYNSAFHSWTCADGAR